MPCSLDPLFLRCIGPEELFWSRTLTGLLPAPSESVCVPRHRCIAVHQSLNSKHVVIRNFLIQKSYPVYLESERRKHTCCRGTRDGNFTRALVATQVTIIPMPDSIMGKPKPSSIIRCRLTITNNQLAPTYELHVNTTKRTCTSLPLTSSGVGAAANGSACYTYAHGCSVSGFVVEGTATGTCRTSKHALRGVSDITAACRNRNTWQPRS